MSDIILSYQCEIAELDSHFYQYWGISPELCETPHFLCSSPAILRLGHQVQRCRERGGLATHFVFLPYFTKHALYLAGQRSFAPCSIGPIFVAVVVRADVPQDCMMKHR